MESLADQMAAILFKLPQEQLFQALESLPTGSLWQACLPEMDPVSTLNSLGPTAPDVLYQLSSAWYQSDGEFLASITGLPFKIDTSGDLSALGRALLIDGTKLAEKEMKLDVFSDQSAIPWGIEIVHQTKEYWENKIYECLDFSAYCAFKSKSLDTVRALVVSDKNDIRGFIPLSDTNARLRFVEALADCEQEDNIKQTNNIEKFDFDNQNLLKSDHNDYDINKTKDIILNLDFLESEKTISVKLEKFKLSFFRRSAACGMLEQISFCLKSIGDGITGYSEDGWPSWWQTKTFDQQSSLRKIPEIVLHTAASMKITPYATGMDPDYNKQNKNL